ncbi:MAG: HAD family hydrolase [Duncaniella sp.]|uniref:HAD family hydrolase n=1 Tax=Duncaniella sp. TaxID=2518496 RepID=UPI0023C8B0E8|nr:HAD family hydrolase [Duncaniella sp.]MDE5988443.1 HAD family hydrolase [Duncaniella sp.]
MVIVFDLDDTLFPEMEFVRSAYRAIARRYGAGLLPAMMSAASPREAFDSTGLPVEDLLGLYRTHVPDIRLPWMSLYVLSCLSRAGHVLGLVTDGRSVTQRHKIEALGLSRFMRPDLIMVSEEIGSGKLSGDAFRIIMGRTVGEGPYVYIGDNPEKDFVAPNALGWLTVGYGRGGNGENIFSYDSLSQPEENRPAFEIGNLPELFEIVNSRRCEML